MADKGSPDTRNKNKWFWSQQLLSQRVGQSLFRISPFSPVGAGLREEESRLNIERLRQRRIPTAALWALHPISRSARQA
jgi:hypothetical protein